MSYKVIEAKITIRDYNEQTEQFEDMLVDGFITPCHKEIKKFIPQGQYDCEQRKYVYEGVKENTVDSIIKEHCSSCIQCKIVSGLSNAKVLPSQQDVADLFGMGYDGYRTASDNFSSHKGVLSHYSTIEAIRLSDGTVINNNECWSRGFAHCSHPHKVPHDKMLHMDLTTASNITGWSGNVTEIKIVEHNDAGVLFTYKDKYYLNGRNSDNRRTFTVELVKPCTTVQEAYDSMKPKEVFLAESQGLEVQRQGELFFIPISDQLGTVNVTDIEKRTRQPITLYHKECSKCGAKTEEHHDSESWQICNHPRYSRWDATEAQKKINECYDSVDDADSLMVLKSRDTYRLTDFPTIMLAVTAPRTYDAHHTATELGKLNGNIVVKGTIRHTSKEHRPLQLGDKWHYVVINNIVQAFASRGGRGSD